MSWSAEAWERTARRVEGLRDEMIELQKKLCAIPALSPAAGGEGALAMQYVLEHTELIRPNDLLVVPDGGSPDGAEIEVAEKSGAWIGIRTHGKQCHASMPEQGVNAFRAGSALVAELEKLYQDFPR